MEINVRFGVVHDEDRASYEKKWQVPYGYSFISYNQEAAINNCRKRGNGWVVEKIFTLPNKVVNFKTIIFRGGNDKE